MNFQYSARHKFIVINLFTYLFNHYLPVGLCSIIHGQESDLELLLILDDTLDVLIFRHKIPMIL